MRLISTFTFCVSLAFTAHAQQKATVKNYLYNMNLVAKSYTGLDNARFGITVNYMTDTAGETKVSRKEKYTCVVMEDQYYVENESFSQLHGEDFKVEVDKVNKFIVIDKLDENHQQALVPAGIKNIRMEETVLEKNYDIVSFIDTLGSDSLHGYTLRLKDLNFHGPASISVYYDPNNYQLKQLIVETIFKEPIPTTVAFNVDSLRRASQPDSAMLKLLNQQYKSRRLFASYTYGKPSPAGTAFLKRFSKQYYVYKTREGQVLPSGDFADYQVSYNLSEIDEMSGDERDRLLKTAKVKAN